MCTTKVQVVQVPVPLQGRSRLQSGVLANARKHRGALPTRGTYQARSNGATVTQQPDRSSSSSSQSAWPALPGAAAAASPPAAASACHTSPAGRTMPQHAGRADAAPSTSSSAASGPKNGCGGRATQHQEPAQNASEGVQGRLAGKHQWASSEVLQVRTLLPGPVSVQSRMHVCTVTRTQLIGRLTFTVKRQARAPIFVLVCRM
jgi:hypothetical protein